MTKLLPGETCKRNANHDSSNSSLDVMWETSIYKNETNFPGETRAQYSSTKAKHHINKRLSSIKPILPFLLMNVFYHLTPFRWYWSPIYHRGSGLNCWWLLWFFWLGFIHAVQRQWESQIQNSRKEKKKMERTEDSFFFPNTRTFPISSAVGKCFYSFPTLCERLLDMYCGIVCVRINWKKERVHGKIFYQDGQGQTNERHVRQSPRKSNYIRRYL